MLQILSFPSQWVFILFAIVVEHSHVNIASKKDALLRFLLRLELK